MQAVSSLMIVPKLRVFRPLEEVRVLIALRRNQSIRRIIGNRALCSLSVHWVADPNDGMSCFLDGADMTSEVVVDLMQFLRIHVLLKVLSLNH